MIALDNDASCVEALYNLGLCNKRLGLYEEALEEFFKLQSIMRNHSQVVYHIATIYELMGDMDQATEWFLQLLGLVPTDPTILQKVGAIFDNEGDKQQAYQYHFDSYRNFPSNLEVIDWLGSYFIEMQVAEKAIIYFERAALMQPDEVKWHLMIASCYRRAGNYHRALETYKSIHRRFPENVECLKFLVKLSSDMGLKEASDYALELKKAERARDVADQRAMSSRPGSRRSSSRNSARTSSAVSAAHSPVDSRTPSRGGAVNRLALDEETNYAPVAKEIDTSYADPLGPMPERPRTSAGVRGGRDEEFEDEEIGDDLLPE
jgi:intraflagellar transport protein 88